MKTRMPHLVLVLPGITGSVLEKDGSEIWAPSRQAIWTGLTSLGHSLQDLKIVHDDPEADDLGDRVVATRLSPNIQIVPGLIKIDGYSSLTSALKEKFDLIEGDANHPAPANFLEFPYDWRRDNRASARKLKQLVEQFLRLWRTHTGNPQAKTILVAHSMGGLVCRYYLECLEGWKDCLSLITFGTPFRGATSALGYLANGYKQLFVDVTEVLRSCTSMYQLLPIYKALEVDGTYFRVAEVAGIPGVDEEKARNALAFHREIEAAVTSNLSNEEYLRAQYRTLPFVGVYQPTFQSATFAKGSVEIRDDLPLDWPIELDGGDGTVPRCSATPIELSGEFRDTFHPERHSALQSNPLIIEDIVNRMRQMVAAEALIHIRGSQPHAEVGGLSLYIDDAYFTGEPIKIAISPVQFKSNGRTLSVRIIQTNTGEVYNYNVPDVDGRWRFTLPPMPVGPYAFEAEVGGGDAPAVHDVFAVVENAA